MVFVMMVIKVVVHNPCLTEKVSMALVSKWWSR